MPSGIVQAIGKSRSGKPTVTVGGQIYSASKLDLSGLQVGDTIEMDTASSVYNGATVWFLNAYKVTQAAIPAPALSQASLHNAVPTPQAQPQNGGMGVLDAERPCVSNWGAELIKAGLIKNPGDLQAWVEGIKSALR